MQTLTKSRAFLNPYEDRKDTTRANAEILTSEYDTLAAIRPARGTRQTTINILIHKLLHELNARNIVDFTSRQRFEYFVANCRFVTPDELEARTAPSVNEDTFIGQSVVGPNAQTTPLDDGRGVARASDLPAQPAKIHPVNESVAGKRVASRATDGKAKKSSSSSKRK